MSITISGLIVALLSWLVGQSGETIPSEQLVSFVDTFGILIGAVLAWYGRWRKGDITVFGARK
jgi:hypothetical protein